MARIQILELPEGADDTRPPFVLVIDQYQPTRYVLGAGDEQAPPLNPFDGMAEQVGARAVLVFEETVEIPGNGVLLDPDNRPMPVDEKAMHHIGLPQWCCSGAFRTLGREHDSGCDRGWSTWSPRTSTPSASDL